MNHSTIFTTNLSYKKDFLKSLLAAKKPTEFISLAGKNIALFSKLTLTQFINEEEIHDRKLITTHTKQSLKSMSSGEQKRVLLQYLLNQTPDYLILDSPFDNLDIAFQKKLKNILLNKSKKINFIHIINRLEDALPINSQIYTLDKNNLVSFKNLDSYISSINLKPNTKNLTIPKNKNAENYKAEELIKFQNVSVSFDNKPILQNINWTINKGDFWQLIGPNGSGKTTLLSMVIGENCKGYGQDLFLFGKKKGSGESIWDIKKKIGYFTPAMNHNFTGNHSIENMVLSGLKDSIGLYVKPTELQTRITEQWLLTANLLAVKNKRFCDITLGQQRLVMLLRALVKQPLLLILDEPTNGLDDENTALFIALVNKIGALGETAIVFVSHRREAKLKPKTIFELMPSNEGSTGKTSK